jgi:hypothetical protein
MALTDESPHTHLLRNSGSPNARRSRWRRYAPALVLFGMLSVGGAYFGLSGVAGDGSSAGPAAPGAGPRTSSKPSAASRAAPVSSLGGEATRIRSGIPVGYPKTREGAESAAVNYAVAYGSAEMFDPARRREIVTAIVYGKLSDDLLKQLDEAFSAAGRRYQLDETGRAPAGFTFVSRTAPIGVKLTAYGGGNATVEVWTAGIVGLAGENSPIPVTEAWATATVELWWSRGDWKWVSFTQRDGPVPVGGMQPSSSGADVAAAVQDFAELRYAR